MPPVFVSRDGTILTKKPFFAKLNDFANQIYLIFMLYITTLFTFDPQKAIEKYHLKQKPRREYLTMNKSSSNNSSKWNNNRSSSNIRPLEQRLGSIDDIRSLPCGSCCGGN